MTTIQRLRKRTNSGSCSCLDNLPISSPEQSHRFGPYSLHVRTVSDTELTMRRDQEYEMTRLLDEEGDTTPRSPRRPLSKLDEGKFFNERSVDVETKKRRRHRRRRSGSFTGGTYLRKHRHLMGFEIPPPNVHSGDWRDMLAIIEYQEKNSVRSPTEIYRKTSDSDIHPRELSYPTETPGLLFDQYMRFVSSSDLSVHRSNWIAATFKRRECSRFVSSSKDTNKCGCGRLKSLHLDIQKLAEEYLQEASVENKRERKDTDEDNGLKMTARRTKTALAERWSLKKHTIRMPTNAYGHIEFQGGPHPYKADYVRLSFDTDPAHIMSLFEHVWQITPPKLIITVHGGTGNFDLQAKLARVFRKGLFKAAMTTGAWIITSGVDTGVVRHVAAAFEGAGSSTRSKVVCIGISPWGLLKNRDSLTGEEITVQYYPHTVKGRFTMLNNRHSYFLLVDNGTVGRYGAEVILRKRLETYIAQKQKIFGGTRSVPVVCVVLEGGSCTIRSVLDYVTNVPRVPVVICDGSGRAADLLAFAHQTVQEDGSLPEGVRPQLVHLVERVFGCAAPGAERIISELIVCAQHKHLMTVFRLGEKGRHDVDHAILTALLKGQNLSPADQLSLALAWNRVDIARSDIFVGGLEWQQSALYNAMMEALIQDRVDFVRLLLEHGVNMQKFLTIGRLEDLYNTDKGPQNTLFYIIRDVVKIKTGYKVKLPHIGMVIEKLMGNAYKSTYTSSEFKSKYTDFMKKYRAPNKLTKSVVSSQARSRGGSAVLSRQSTDPMILGNFSQSINDAPSLSENMMAANKALGKHLLWRTAYRRDNTFNLNPPKLHSSQDICSEEEESHSVSTESKEDKFEFRYPFSELLIWAVLTKRQEMAMCMWQHGEEAMAKALIACRLYKSLATEAAEDYLEVEICDELKKYAEEFRMLSMELLEHCYQQDDAQTVQLLTYELSNWGYQTCLSLAVLVNNKQFLAHPCCQILLADLWHGGLRMRSHSNLKVATCVILVPLLFCLEFKSPEELMNQPQRAAEHDEMSDDGGTDVSTSDSSASSSSDSSSDDDDKEETDKEQRRIRKQSHGSTQSINFISLIRSRRRKEKEKNEGDISCPEAKAENGDAVSYGTFVGQSGAISPPSFVRKSHHKVQWDKDNVKSDISTRGSVVGSTKNSVAVTKESGFIKKHLPNFPGPTVPKMRKLKWKSKFYEFYAAPITTFWNWALSFCAFMMVLSYVLLIRTPLKPTYLEWFLFAYVFSFGCEYLRRFLMSEMERFSQKIRYFFSNFWNTITFLAIITFYIGFGLRLSGNWTLRNYGRVILACDSVLWGMKLLDFMSVHPKLGPYITMAGKMVQNMVYIIVMLMVSLLCFGLSRQSITYPNEEWHWILVRNIFYKPYFMLYGEVYADEIDTCGDEAWDAHFEDGEPLSLYSNGTLRSTCVPGHWIPPILMTIFLLIANILLMSMLIAIFNHIFDATNSNAQQIWLFQRYRQVMEYESTPSWFPPFTPIRHAWMLVQYIRWKCCCEKTGDKDQQKRQKKFDYSLKLFLGPDQIEKLHDFEEDCMDDLAREKDQKKHTSNEERIYRTVERTEQILSRVNDIQTKETTNRETLSEVEQRLQSIEKNQEEILEYIRMVIGLRGISPVTSGLDIRIDPPDETEEKEENLAPLPLSKRTRTNTFCGADKTRDSTDDGLTSPQPFRRRFDSHGSVRQLKRFAKRDEYTTITDAIVVADIHAALRSLSCEHGQESANNSDILDSGDERRKKPLLDIKRQRSEPTPSTLKPAYEDEEADCELTDVSYENDEIEEMYQVETPSKEEALIR